MSTDLQNDVEALKKDLNDFREHLKTTLSDAGSYSRDKVHQTKNNLKNAVQAFEGKAVEKVGHAGHVLHEEGEKAVATSREMIYHRPITAVAVAFGAGMLTALLMKRSDK